MVQPQFEPKQSGATAYAFNYCHVVSISLIPVSVANNQYF